MWVGRQGCLYHGDGDFVTCLDEQLDAYLGAGSTLSGQAACRAATSKADGASSGGFTDAVLAQ